MQVSAILSKHLSKVMHKTRLGTLCLMVESLFHAKIFNLTGLGRALKTEAQERSAIRRMDRFLGNKRLQKDRRGVYKIVCKLLIGSIKRPLIIVDWSTIPNKSHNVLRAALVTSGRALTLYEEIHPEKKSGTHKVHVRFLKKLNSMIDNDCKPIIITDAGFHSNWFEAVCNLGWDYVGRIRGNKHYREITQTSWNAISSLHQNATSTPKYLGEIELCQKSGFFTHLFCYKSAKKNRKDRSKRGKVKENAASRKHAKGNKEPWILVASLPRTSKIADKIIKIYSTRMQIEEAFRDLKSTKYGFGFEHVNTQHIYRLNVFFLLSMLASFLAWVTGWLAEKEKLHTQYQANSTQWKRVLSLFYLGYRIIRREKNRIKTTLIQKVIDNFPSFCEEII